MTTMTVPAYQAPALRHRTTALITRRPAPARTRPEPVLRAVARSAATTGGLIAVDDAGYHATYAEVWHAAARTRRDLTEAGVEPGDVVGVAAEPGTGLVAAILGVWLTGAAYLPVDPARPGAGGIVARAVVAGPGLRPGSDLPVVPMVEVVAAPTEPPYAPMPPGEAVAVVLPARARSGRTVTTRLTHDDLATLIAGSADDPRPLTGSPVLRMFLPLSAGGRVRFSLSGRARSPR
ncbi:AMP-binding protein [Paractinoplanes abujensis]|uniref:Non-ribosomal peptide synthetase component F n=1 Tax=Paractinoplanes abujensis TaxID=882441 RepID=A0A7W7G3R0_9ACTN|nr:AMP-binding protein [Actinoplanes abujensis]MBB4693026.1 non-ribosomal peptide synthetase component F [Actinoplanes abujensis]